MMPLLISPKSDYLSRDYWQDPGLNILASLSILSLSLDHHNHKKDLVLYLVNKPHSWLSTIGMSNFEFFPSFFWEKFLINKPVPLT